MGEEGPSTPPVFFRTLFRSTYPGRQVARETYFQRQVARDTPDLSLGKKANVVVTSSSKASNTNPISRFKNKTPVRFDIGKSIADIPVFEMSDEECEDEYGYTDRIEGVSKEYYDHGDQTKQCMRCGSLLWLAESMVGSTNANKNDGFSLCCGRGKIKLPVALKNHPPLLMGLLNGEHPKSKSFMEDIRRYNSMFALHGWLLFTSFPCAFLSLIRQVEHTWRHPSIEMVESFYNSYYIPDEVHPTTPGRDRTITQFPEGKVGVYTRFFDYCGYRIPLTKFFVAVLKYFRIHISQLSPFGAARISHFEVLTRVLDLGPSVAVFRAFYTRIYSDGLFLFAKRSLSSPSCLSKPPDSIKNWADHFFWVDSWVFHISVPLYTGSVLEKDPAPYLTARQEQAVQVLSSNKAPFRQYPECFLALVGLSPYYPFGENTYPVFEGPDRTDMGLLDYIRTANLRKVQAVEVQKGEEQVTLLESIKHCFVSLDAPDAVHQASGSGSGAGPEVSVPSAGENVVAEGNVIPVGTYVDLVDPEDNLTVVEKGDAAQKQPEKAKRKKLSKQSDPLHAKRLRIDHPSLSSGTGGKTLANLRRTIPEGSLLLGSSPADVHTQVTVRSSRTADAPVYTATDTVTSSRGKTLVVPTSDVGGSSQPKTSEESADSFYETAVLNSEDAKHWYVPRWNITNDSLLDDGFSCRTLVDCICLGSEVRSRTEHELELKEKLQAKYDARGVLLSEKDAEIARLKSLVREKETESAEVLRLRDQVSVLAADKSLLSAEVSVLKNVVSQKDTDISLLDSRASYLKSAL
ncbi:hypothetical protein Tco_0179029, partial [Tanacetum coccineum]